MKKLLYIIIIICLNYAFGYAQPYVYYVAPADSGGNDAAAGTIVAPWGTLQKAINEADAGDTVYFRGGVYYMTAGAKINPTYRFWQGVSGNDGTAEARIHYFNYPGEEPIFDGTNCQDEDGYMTGLAIDCAHFLSFRGLTFRNFYQRGNHWWVQGITATLCSNLRFEQITIHDIGGRGLIYNTSVGDRRGTHETAPDWPGPLSFLRYGDTDYPVYIPYDSTYFINCDIYNCADTTAVVEGGTAFNLADGFKINNSAAGYIYVEGCRAWNCSDDGFDMSGSALTIYKNNWSFYHGHFQDAIDGNGFKYGSVQHYDYDALGESYVTRRVYNNIAAFNAYSGFWDGMRARSNRDIFNNTSYGNHIGFFQGTNVVPIEGEQFRAKFRNNISYLNDRRAVQSEGQDTENNTWRYYVDGDGWAEENPDFTVTDADFVSVDSVTIMAQLTAPRKPDGSLPDITVFRLAQDSDLKGAGTYVGMSAGPDIGIDWAFLDGEIDETATNIISFIFSGVACDIVISSINRTVTVNAPPGTDVTNMTPTISVSPGATILPTSGTARDFTTPQVYNVTAADEITEREWTVTVTVESFPSDPSGRRFIRTANGKFTKSISGKLLYYAESTPTPPVDPDPDQPSPEAGNKKMIFIHHSTGGRLIADNWGGLGDDLNDEGYFLSDAGYDWDATLNEAIGDETDIGNWWTWFMDQTVQSNDTTRRDNIMRSVYTEYLQDASMMAIYGNYTRTVSDPGGENEIIMFKSCYPNSDIQADNQTTPVNMFGEYWNNAYTESNVRVLYDTILVYLKANPEKMFIVLTAPPNRTTAHGARARAFNNWLVNNWLQDANWDNKNVYVYDYFNVLTDEDNHHWVVDGEIVHYTDPGSIDNADVYADGLTTSRPSPAGQQKVASEFIPVLEIWYNTWRATLED